MFKQSDYSTINFLETKTERLAYRYVFSDPSLPTILLIHGNMGSSSIWITLIDYLKSKYNLLCPDLRGFGDSSYNVPIVGLEDYCADIIATLNHLSLSTVWVIGLSLGGAVSLSFCSKHPEFVKGLILMGSVGLKGYYYKKTDYQGKISEAKMPDKDFLEKDPYVSTYSMVLMTKNHEFLQILLDKFLFNGSRKVSDTVFKLMVDEALKQKNYVDSMWALNIFNMSDTFNGVSKGTNEISNLDCPILVIHGNKDKIIPVKESINIYHALKGEKKRIEILENMGHVPHLEDPEKVSGVLAKFFEESTKK